MGRIVGGFATSHVLFPPEGVEDKAARVLDGMLEIRRRVQALEPDVLVLAGADHLNNFNLALQVTLAVGVSDSFTTLGDSGAPPMTFPGARGFAESFARQAAHDGFDLVQVEESRPDHGLAIPKLLLDPEGRIPTVPVWINAAMPIPPSPSRCYGLGGALRRAVETLRPDGERVVVVGTGGLSHWLCRPQQGEINEAFDRHMMDEIVQGRAEGVAAMSSDEMVEQVGNGGLEATAWLFMAGSLPGARGETVYYEAVPEWISGMGGLALNP